VRPEATFCGQCYADFRPPPPPVAAAPSAPLAPAPTAAYGIPALDPLTAPLLDIVLPVAAVPTQPGAPAVGIPAKTPARWPCTRCEALNDFTDTVCKICAAPFLATVAEESKVTLVLPVVGDLGRYSRGQRALIAFGAVLAVLLPLALIMLLTTGSPSGGTSPSTPGSTTSTTTSNTTTTGG
jgi:hypothetical protein